MKKGGKGKHQQLVMCALDYHNEYFFGLARDDAAMMGLGTKEWCMPTDQMREDNAEHIKRLKKEYILKKWTKQIEDGDVQMGDDNEINDEEADSDEVLVTEEVETTQE